jgi:hypothetical protein
MNLMGVISDGIGTMAMVNYPYDTQFIGTLPANPVSVACEKGVVNPG